MDATQIGDILALGPAHLAKTRSRFNLSKVLIQFSSKYAKDGAIGPSYWRFSLMNS